MKDRWMIIDVSNWAHKLLYAGRSDAERAVEAFRRWHDYMDVNVKPFRIVYAFDSPGHSFRKQLLPSYKANRKPPPVGLADVLDGAERLAIDEGCEIVRSEGFEADDLIATVAEVARTRNARVVICSSDKDLRQLLRRGEVTIATTVSVSKGIEWFTEATLMENFGLRPSQWIDYQTLVGDSTDNVGGCPGIGDKRARDLLRRCGSIDDYFKHPWRTKLSERQRAEMLRFRSCLDVTRQLVTLRTDVPLGDGWEETLS
ncbi:MAG: 5'-3' exonuclease H3TH domain-containing protein, partial [Planctomycetota bacterium]